MLRLTDLLAVCGGDIFLTEAKGHLESPNFPEDYQPSKECVWNLKVQEGYQIALKFQTFEVGQHTRRYPKITRTHTF